MLIKQLNHESPGVQCAAVQELSLLAASSETCRIGTLAAAGDRQLVRLAGMTNDAGVLRWTFNALNALAADEWARRRQVDVVARLHALLVADHGSSADDEASAWPRSVLHSAAGLLANLAMSDSVLSALSHLGDIPRLAARSHDVGDGGLLFTLQAGGLVARASLPPLGDRDGFRGSPLPHRPLGATLPVPPLGTAGDFCGEDAEDTTERRQSATRVQAVQRGRRQRRQHRGEARAATLGQSAHHGQATVRDRSTDAAVSSTPGLGHETPHVEIPLFQVRLLAQADVVRRVIAKVVPA